MNAGLSIHVVDIAHGRIASGLRVRIDRLEGAARVPIVDAAVGARGTVDQLAALAGHFGAGVYEATFQVGDFYRAAGLVLPAPPFLDEVPYRFGIADPGLHVHLPFKMTPYGFSCFRGGA